MAITLDLDTTNANSVDDTSSYTENGGNLTLFGNASVSSGADVIDSITLTIANYNGTETLSVSNLPATLFAIWNSNTGTLTITPVDFAVVDSSWQTALNSVVYNDASNNAPSTSRTITVTASNNVDSFPTATETINVTRVNDLPSVTMTPTEYNTTEQTSLNLKGTGISVSDLDSGNANVTLNLVVTEGSLFVTIGDVVGINSIQRNGTSDISIIGTLTAINTLLAAGGTSTLTYLNNSDTPQSDVTLKLVFQDNGNTGTGGSIPSIDTATIHIAPVNDVAVSLANTKAAIAENSSTATHIKVADIVLTDPDGGTNTVGLTGDDADFFEIVGTELFLKAGTVLDFESKTSYAVAVTADDTSVGGTPDATSSLYTLNVNNISPETIFGTNGGNDILGGSDNDLIYGLDGNDELGGVAQRGVEEASECRTDVP